MSASPYDLVAIVASAGGLKAMEAILERLPDDFPIPIALAQHRANSRPEILARVLGRHTGLTVKLAEEGEALRPATVYISLPDRHLAVSGDRTLALVDGRKVRHTLSSGTVLFESAAAHLGARVIGVVLSGYDSDGTDGVQAIHAAGGVVLAQDEASSQSFEMPRSAIATGAVDAVLPAKEIGAALTRLASGYPPKRVRGLNRDASRSSS